MLLHHLFENDMVPSNAAAISLVRALGDIIQEIDARGGTNIQCALQRTAGTRPFGDRPFVAFF